MENCYVLRSYICYIDVLKRDAAFSSFGRFGPEDSARVRKIRPVGRIFLLKGTNLPKYGRFGPEDSAGKIRPVFDCPTDTLFYRVTESMFQSEALDGHIVSCLF